MKSASTIADSSEAFVFFDSDGRIQLWNNRFPLLLGLAESDVKRDDALAPLLLKAGMPADLLERLDIDPPGTTMRHDRSRPLLELPGHGWVRASLRLLPHGERALILARPAGAGAGAA